MKNQNEVILTAPPVPLPTEFGTFSISVYRATKDGKEQAVLTYGDITKGVPMVRMHSECLTGDTFRSLRCDCGPQLTKSLKMIAKAGAGVLLYLNQEGRGIGLTNKIKAYALQDQGLDTLEANLALHLPADARDYSVAAGILCTLGLCTIALVTNNPDKEQQLEKYGLTIAKLVPLEIEPNKVDKKYLVTKKKRFGHRLNKV